MLTLQKVMRLAIKHRQLKVKRNDITKELNYFRIPLYRLSFLPIAE
jgi:hypothetical protein